MNDLKTIMNGLNLPDMKKKEQAHSTDAKFDRFRKKEFSRRKMDYIPQLINDSYAQFRFQKRASEVISPLNKSKFGFTHQNLHFRKMSHALGQTSGLPSTKSALDRSIFGVPKSSLGA